VEVGQVGRLEVLVSLLAVAGRAVGDGGRRTMLVGVLRVGWPLIERCSGALAQ